MLLRDRKDVGYSTPNHVVRRRRRACSLHKPPRVSRRVATPPACPNYRCRRRTVVGVRYASALGEGASMFGRFRERLLASIARRVTENCDRRSTISFVRVSPRGLNSKPNRMTSRGRRTSTSLTPASTRRRRRHRSWSIRRVRPSTFPSTVRGHLRASSDTARLPPEVLGVGVHIQDCGRLRRREGAQEGARFWSRHGASAGGYSRPWVRTWSRRTLRPRSASDKGGVPETISPRDARRWRGRA